MERVQCSTLESSELDRITLIPLNHGVMTGGMQCPRLCTNRTDGKAPRGFVLTDDHRMLLDIRDTLYEGSWEDFKTDLVARCESKPHVFETVPDSAHMREVIRYHLDLITQMRGVGEKVWNGFYTAVLPIVECLVGRRLRLRL